MSETNVLSVGFFWGSLYPKKNKKPRGNRKNKTQYEGNVWYGRLGGTPKLKRSQTEKKPRGNLKKTTTKEMREMFGMADLPEVFV